MLIFVFILFLVSSLSAQVKINEFCADNDAGVRDPDFNEYGDWIELYNSSDQAISLTGMYLTDDPTNLLKWPFSGNAQIPAGGFLLVWADNKNSSTHTNFRLNVAGEYIALTSTMGIVMDSVRFGSQLSSVSYGRLTDGSQQWVFFLKPTPGATNNGQTGNLVSPPPVFSLERGFYGGPISLVLSIPGGSGIIRYTRDGSDPAAASDRYTNPLEIKVTTVIRARVYKDEAAASPIVTQTYFISEPTTLPVFSITTNPKNLWDEDTGIYVPGRNYVWGWGNGNFWQDWEKEAFVEFFERDRSVKIAQLSGLKIAGALSRTSSQKSLRLTARRSYGEPRFDYRFFKDKEVKTFNDIKLRTSGNDWAFSMMKDGLAQTIIAGQMDIDYQAYRPTIVFLNGDYWGIHNLREFIGDDYIQDNHGFDKSNLDIISQVAMVVKEGDSKNYTELLAFLKNNDISNADNYAWVKDRVDIQEYINYNVAEIYFANVDWPGGNIKYWRPRIEGGKWRWIIFDLDLGLDYVWHNTIEWATTKTPPEYPGSTDFFRIMMTNPDFRELFLKTFQSHLNTTFEPNRLVQIIDSLQSNIAPEMARHISRWKNYHGWTFMDPVLGYIETPSLPSYSKWVENVDYLRNFARQRRSFVNGFLQTYYNMTDPVDVTFSADPPEAGKLLVDNSMAVSNKVSGTYFANQTISVQGYPNPRYKFDNWEVKRNTIAAGETVKLIPPLSTWKYLDTGIYPNSTWKDLSFSETWTAGCAWLGYNDENACTTIGYGTDPQNKHISTLFRKKFRVKSSSQWSKLTIGLLRDDGAIVYLNGTEVVRSNMPAVSDFGTWASSGADNQDEVTYFPFDIPVSALRSGENVIAVEVHQVNPTSSDLIFDLSLTGVVGTESSESQVYTEGELSQKYEWKSSVVGHFSFTGEIPDLSINEVMPVNLNYYPDRLGAISDWIEIYNPGNVSVNLGGMYITDNFDNPGKWMIPGNNPLLTTVPPRGFIVLFADEKQSLGPDHLGFKLTGTGELVGLSVKTSTGFTWVDTLNFPGLLSDISFGRYPDGSNQWESFTVNPTPGTANKEDGETTEDIVKLYPVFPNPFTDHTYIRFSLTQELPVQILVRDLSGNPIYLVTNRTYRSGIYRMEWNGKDSEGRNVPPGIYLISMITPYTIDTYKAVLMR
jgi:hypothetical protein